MKSGPDLFDDQKFSEGYLSFRHRPESPNESLERPVLMELMGPVSTQHILDLGCGDGVFGLELIEAGCEYYLGIDASETMVEAAKKNMGNRPGEIIQSMIEAWAFPQNQFDLVVSRLTLHYIENLDYVFAKVHAALKQDGRFVFSIVHPVITSSDKSRLPGSSRQDWIVDDYFSPGSRKVVLGEDDVTQFHRTIEDLYVGLQQAGFRIEHLRESKPRRENFEDEALFQRRNRIPLFLFFSSVKI